MITMLRPMIVGKCSCPLDCVGHSKLHKLMLPFIFPQRMLSSRVLKRGLSTVTKSFDHVVVGGGPVGCSIAYHLAKSGAKNIAVLEQDNSYRTASAMLSAGGIRQQFSVPENVKMQIYGAQFLKNNEDLSVNGEVPDLQFHENGYLFLSNEETKDILLGNYKIQKENGADWISLLEKQDLEAKFPWLSTEDLAIGTFGTMNEGYFDPWLFVSAVRKKAQSLGVQFLERKVVGGQLIPTTAASISSFQVDSLRTINPKNPSIEEKIVGGSYINAAGAWSGRLVAALASSLTNPSSVHTLPVNPRKRCIFAIHCNAATGVPPSNSPLVVDNSGVYFRPEIGRKGHFILGVSPSEDQDPDIREHEEKDVLQFVDHQIFEDVIWPALATRVPAFAEVKVTSSWAGFYDYNSLDQNAIIGFHPELSNMMLSTGFSGHGLMQSPAAGRAVSELLLNNNRFQTLDLSRFSFERILKNEPILEIGII